MAKAKEITVEDKLRALYDLQIVDKHIDKIRAMRGELPLEVQDLEDEIEGLDKRLTKLIGGVEELDQEINNKKLLISDSEGKIVKYNQDQKNVRNNREFDAITKEIEYQGLEIELANKKIKETLAKIEHKNETIVASKEKLDQRKSHLEFKKNELDDILADTQKEEDLLVNKSEELSGFIEDRLLKAYKRIRSASKNGLAVVSIERGASAGSFFVIPPQRQLEIAQRKKIMIDEHSGRILVDPELAQEEEDKIHSLIESIKK